MIILIKPAERQSLDPRYTWDLTALYQSDEEWEKSLQEIEEIAGKIALKKGRLAASAGNLFETLSLMDQLGIKMEWAWGYAKMSFDVDMGDPRAKLNYEKIDNLWARISDSLAFYEPELLQLDPSVFDEYKNQVPALNVYSFMFEKLFKQKEHILSVSEEEILARMSSLGSAFQKIYNDLTVNDLVFPEIEDEHGEKIIANEVNYRRMLTSYNRNIREKFFKGLLGTYGSHINSLASVIYGNLKYRRYMAKTRKYRSSLEMAMNTSHIPTEVYETLIRTVRSNVHLLHRYLELRKKRLGLDRLHFYDLFVPLVKESKEEYSFEQARDTICAALKVLGEDYQTVLREAFDRRWLDVYPNKGKVHGAYANGIYGLHPYALLNFTGTLEDAFTLAHELGHVMHSYYSNRHQPYVNSGYAIFTAEVASTANEYFLYRYLLENAVSNDKKAYLLNMHLDSIRSTLYRQAFFADFELTMHHLVEQDVPVTPQTLCEQYKKLYEYYHGPEFTIDEELAFEWARIPHFYNSFYVYQYATGISAAISLAKRVLSKEPGAVDSYLRFLGRGGSDYPINLLREAGVDMTSPAPIVAALQDFSESMDHLEAIL